jgi:hypothetical protein
MNIRHLEKMPQNIQWAKEVAVEKSFSPGPGHYEPIISSIK